MSLESFTNDLTKRTPPLVKQLRSGNNIKNYWGLWTRYFKDAIVLAKALGATTGQYDVLDRFFVPPPDVPSFELFFLPTTPPGKDQKLSLDQLRTCVAFLGSDYGVIPECIDHPAANHYRLSQNPLGLYETWIDAETLRRLVQLQTGDSGWIRTMPNDSQVQDFNTTQLEAGGLLCSLKSNAVFPYIATEHPIFSGDMALKRARIATKRVMGESANMVLDY